jgi:hypothetical protein
VEQLAAVAEGDEPGGIDAVGADAVVRHFFIVCWRRSTLLWEGGSACRSSA